MSAMTAALHDTKRSQMQHCRSSRHDDSVLQFLLGAAPLSAKAQSEHGDTRAFVTVDSAAKAHDDGEEESDVRDTPLLEYVSDVESDDDYIDIDSSLSIRNATSDKNGRHDGRDSASTAAVDCSSRDHEDPTATGAIDRSAATAAASIDSTAKKASDHDDDAHSETSSNCTDSDGSLSDSDSHAGTRHELLDEVEHEPTDALEQSTEHLHKLHTSASNSMDASQLEQQQQQQLSPPGAAQSQHKRALGGDNRAPRKPTSRAASSDALALEPTAAESAFVGVATLAMLLYIAATVLAFFDPHVAPLPPLASLQSPVDLSNVSIAIARPLNHSLLQLPLVVDWTLSGYPASVLETFGPEVFQYRIAVDTHLVVSELGFLTGTNDAAGTSINSVDTNLDTSNSVSTRVQHTLAHEHFPTFATYIVEVDVLLPVPGADGKVHRIIERVVVTHALDLSWKFALVAPTSGAVFALNDPVVLQYVATANVKRLDVVLNGRVVATKQRIHDGTLLLRGLSRGTHTLGLVGMDAAGKRVASTGADMATIEIV